ncbi:hypothetical protein V2A60_001306 [Cordyceps javanica]
MPVQQTIDTSKLSSASAQDAATQSRRSSKSPSPSGEPDATTAVPSQMREHLGPPQITHEYPQDSTHRRHSSVSAQQAHFMKYLSAMSEAAGRGGPVHLRNRRRLVAMEELRVSSSCTPAIAR